MNSRTLTALLLFGGSLCSQPIQHDSLDRALSGYDVVNYYSDSFAEKGDSSLAVNYREVQWLFISEKNRDLFLENPERYLPEYGGYCSWGMKFGGTFEADHKQFTLYDGKLYFNQDEQIERWWRRRREWNIKRADKKWLRLQEADKNQNDSLIKKR